jgi:Tfp pilus assembly protein PilO
MNWKKLPQEKKNQFVLVIIVTIGVLSALGFGLIQLQYRNLSSLATKRATAEQKLKSMQEAVKHTDQLEAELVAAHKTLEGLEEDLASGDLYAWLYSTIRNFKLAYKLDLPQFGSVSPPVEMNLLPNFPYKQASLTVAGTSHFHDFGKFLADFENQFPHMRVVNLRLDAIPGSPGAQDAENISFTMEIVTLVKATS